MAIVMRGVRDADMAPGTATLEGATVPARRANRGPGGRSRPVIQAARTADRR
jgi:hypothetical protein